MVALAYMANFSQTVVELVSNVTFLRPLVDCYTFRWRDF